MAVWTVVVVVVGGKDLSKRFWGDATKSLVRLFGTTWRNTAVNQLTDGKLAGSSVKGLGCRNCWKLAAWAPLKALGVISALCLEGVLRLSVLLWKQWGAVAADSVISVDLKAHAGFLRHPSVFCTSFIHTSGWGLLELIPAVKALAAVSTLDRLPAYRRG